MDVPGRHVGEVARPATSVDVRRALVEGRSARSAPGPATSAIASGGDDRVDDAVLGRFSAVCTPSGNVLAVQRLYTRGPRNPMRAPGSATVTWPSEPHDARTPPVVGLRR